MRTMPILMPRKNKFRQIVGKTKEFVFNWRTTVLFLASAIAFLSPFLAASGSEAASSEYLATLIRDSSGSVRHVHRRPYGQHL